MTFYASPELSLPISDTESIALGGGAELGSRLEVGGLPFAAEASFGAEWYKGSNNGGFDLMFGGAGFGVYSRPSPRLRLGAEIEGGYFYAQAFSYSDLRGGSLYFGAGLGAGLELGKNFELRLTAGLRDYYGLCSAAIVGLCASYGFEVGGKTATEAPAKPKAPAKPIVPKTPASPVPKPQLLKAAPPPAPAKEPPGLRFKEARLDPIFPVLFKYYDEHPVGRVVLKNNYSVPVEDVKVSYFVNQYMDNPKLCGELARIEAGCEASVELCALFNDRLLGVTEGTKVSAKLVTEYSLKGAKARSVEETTRTLRILDRNASMWDDDRKVAAFVTSKDQSVLRFSKNVLAMVREKSPSAVNQKLAVALAFHEATRLYGLTYVVDPTNSYAAVLGDKTAVDFLQFPRQTLDYKGGNCSALSILYCALLESVGIETAFITVPGHILMALCLEIQPAEARSRFASPDELVIVGDKVWLPIETTARDSGFVRAWQMGAKEWRENLAKGQAAIYPVHEAWALYEPVAFASDMASFALPERGKLVAAYQAEMAAYVDREIYAKVSELNADIKKGNRAPAIVNKLGVLYARYGLVERARAKFQEAESAGYAPATINLGHLSYQQGDYKAALASYERAARAIPERPELLLAIARANHELENYGVVKSAYERLKALSPGLAEQYAYLALRGEEGTRAADASGVKGIIEWSEP